MRITNLRIETQPQHQTVGLAATVTWEDCPHAAVDLHIRTSAAFADALRLTPEPFVLAAMPPAFRAGEKRIAVEGSLCPELRDGLVTAMHVLAGWHDPKRRLPNLEPSQGFAPLPQAPPRTGLFLSGGIDSLASLRHNMLDLPADHPHRVRDAWFVYGFDIGRPGTPQRLEFFERARQSLEPAAHDAGARLIPVFTNLRELEPRGPAWPKEWVGAALAAVAHAFTPAVNRALIAAGPEIDHLGPSGTHPMLDACYSSSAISVVHYLVHLTKMQRVRLIADWPQGLRCVRVCYEKWDSTGPLNCGKCLKCVRTRMALLALGKLEQAVEFPDEPITAGQVLELHMTWPSLMPFSHEMRDALRACGRQDLADALQRQIDECARARAWQSDRGLKGALRRFDRRFLRGTLLKLSERIGRRSV
jgi:hypothetical protein